MKTFCRTTKKVITEFRHRNPQTLKTFRLTSKTVTTKIRFKYCQTMTTYRLKYKKALNVFRKNMNSLTMKSACFWK